MAAGRPLIATGLSITRSIVEAAGGCIHAVNRASAEHASRSNCPPAPSDARRKPAAGRSKRTRSSGANRKCNFNDLRVRRIQCSKQL